MRSHKKLTWTCHVGISYYLRVCTQRFLHLQHQPAYELQRMSRSASSEINSCGRKAPICGHHQPMRMFVSKSKSNPGRKYWKCRNWGKNDDCNGFQWDDEIDSEIVEGGSLAESEQLLEVMRNLGAEFGKNFVQEVGMSMNKMKIEKLKMKAAKDQKIINALTCTLIVSWLFFVFLFSSK
ncbi:uncharacterized protein LOC131655484 [Vicia villosa]|uniref:uncharacterized protein LOC131647207 n=1 Tax=Vicia villosa TaxID=3911 RepID=UPI00273C7947|nr:uncharacterized protein LOC131647207 [Vicia villosa]XP_058781328.1 uncharacterized protein LOC131655484 [Vicia villosa]